MWRSRRTGEGGENRESRSEIRCRARCCRSGEAASEGSYEDEDASVSVVSGFAMLEELERCRKSVDAGLLAIVLGRRTAYDAIAPSPLGPATDMLTLPLAALCELLQMRQRKAMVREGGSEKD